MIVVGLQAHPSEGKMEHKLNENIITKDNNKIKSEERLHEIRPGLLDAIRIHKKEQRTQDEAFFDAGLSNQKNKLS